MHAWTKLNNVPRRGLGAWLASLALIVSLAVASPALAQAQDAEVFVDKVGKDAVAILQDDALSDDDKITRLRELLNEAVDLELVARLVMGTYWRQASPEQQQAFVEAFRRLVTKTMASQLGNYSGETFNVVGSQQANERDTLVQTEIIRPAAENVRVQWRIRQAEGSNSIIDILAEDVSLVVTQRNEVASLVARRGIDGLIAEMQARAASDNPLEGFAPLEQEG